MTKNSPLVKNIFWALLFFFTMALGMSLRMPGYALVPEPYIILDEHTNVWHGLSLRKTGIPTAWSILAAYKADSYTMGAGGPLDGLNLSVDGRKPTPKNFSSFPKPVVGLAEFDFGRGINNTPLVQPYLDHPPFGAVVLSLLVSKNVNTLRDVNDADLRRSAVLLAALTQLLIFVLAIIVTRKPLVGIIASTVYATVPSYLLLGRYALLENVMSPLVLVGTILLLLARSRLEDKKIDNLSRLMILLAGIVGGLTALTKLTGWIFILGSITLLYLWKFKIKEILTYAIPAFFVGVLYFAWGLYLSPKLFTDILLTQSSRDFIGSINLLVTFFRVSIFNFPLDGWWTGGFVALLFLPGKKEHLPIIVMSVAALFSALGLSGANYPWYFIPLIPFMTIAVAVFFYNLAIKPTFAAILLTFFTFISSSFYWGYGVYQKTQPYMLYRIMFLLFIGTAVFWAIKERTNKHRKIWYWSVIAILILLALLNRRSVFFILENWGKLPLIYTPGTF